jgi:hypothetical protein
MFICVHTIKVRDVYHAQANQLYNFLRLGIPKGMWVVRMVKGWSWLRIVALMSAVSNPCVLEQLC